MEPRVGKKHGCRCMKEYKPQSDGVPACLAGHEQAARCGVTGLEKLGIRLGQVLAACVPLSVRFDRNYGEHEIQIAVWVGVHSYCSFVGEVRWMKFR